jgi:predicted XRE-type DNA-binding protein
MPKTKIVPSSGNIFADIGVADPDQALAKAEVARRIVRVIAKTGMTQTKVAAILGIDQPRVCALTKGRLALFSLEKLLTFASKLGSGVEIRLGTQNSGILVVDGFDGRVNVASAISGRNTQNSLSGLPTLQAIRYSFGGILPARENIAGTCRFGIGSMLNNWAFTAQTQSMQGVVHK